MSDMPRDRLGELLLRLRDWELRYSEAVNVHLAAKAHVADAEDALLNGVTQMHSLVNAICNELVKLNGEVVS